MHAHPFIYHFGVLIVGLGVEPKSAHVALIGCPPFDKLIKSAVYSLPPGCRSNINALNPPKPAVSPIAPFERYHQPAEDAVLILRDYVKAFFFVCEHSFDASAKRFRIKMLTFGLERHREVKLDQSINIVYICQSNVHTMLDARHRRPLA